MIYFKFQDKFKYIIKNYNKYFVDIEKNRLYIFLKRFTPLILTILFIFYISYSLSKSEINSFEPDNLEFLINFFLFSFSITPIFIISSSIRFHLVKVIFEVNTNFIKSIKSILISSSLDAFTPAKVNDFARLKNETKRKKVFFIILLERLTDLFILILFLFLSNLYSKLFAIFLFSFLIINSLDLFIFKRKLNLKRISLFFLSVLLTGIHWNLAFTIFKKSFYTFSKIFNYDYELIKDVITIKKFSLMTLISVLPIGIGGFGLREVSSLRIFNHIDSSLVLTASLSYGLAVSGLLTFIGISYVNIRKIFLK